MTVQKFDRKPTKASTEGIYAAQYHVGQPLDDLQAVAAMADYGDHPMAECVLADETVLVVRWFRSRDDGPGREEYEIVKDGHWLYYSPTYESLGDDTTRGIEQWYDPVPSS